MLNVLLITFGLLALFCGGELLVRGAAALASRLGMSPLLVGLTIVSLGTSAPELAISIEAVLKHSPDIAVGNIVGSNISNAWLIVGITALIIPISVVEKVIRIDGPIMIAMAVGFTLLALDGSIGFTDGCVLILLITSYLVLQFWLARSRPTSEINDEVGSEFATQSGSHRDMIWMVCQVLGGGILLWLGGGWLVAGATELARMFGVSQLVIGLTIVALGSSAPELVTSLVAALRGHPEIAIGNVVGSNISNVALIGGVASILSPSGLPVPTMAVRADMPIMVLSAFLLQFACVTNRRVSRKEGAVFLLLFIGYMSYLFLAAR